MKQGQLHLELNDSYGAHTRTILLMNKMHNMGFKYWHDKQNEGLTAVMPILTPILINNIVRLWAP